MNTKLSTKGRSVSAIITGQHNTVDFIKYISGERAKDGLEVRCMHIVQCNPNFSNLQEEDIGSRNGGIKVVFDKAKEEKRLLVRMIKSQFIVSKI